MSKVLKPDQVAQGSHKDALSALEEAVAGDAIHREAAARERLLAQAAVQRAEVLREAKQEAGRIVAAAKGEAAELLRAAEAARDEVARVTEAARVQGHREGFDAGFQEGVVAGREEGIKGLHDLTRTLETVIDDALAKRASALETAREDLVKLAVAIAEKILARELARDSDFLNSVVDSVIPGLDRERIKALRVAPDTLAEWEQDAAEFVRAKRRYDALQIVADDSLGSGDVVIDTEWGFVDGRLRHRWQRIMEGLDLVEAP